MARGVNRNPDRGGPIACAVGEPVDRRRFMRSGETPLIARTVDGKVILVERFEPGAQGLDVVFPTHVPGIVE